MKKAISFTSLAFIFVLFSAIYDPTMNIAEIKFDVIDNAIKGSLTIPQGSSEDQYHFLELEWSTGEIGRSITITSPGTYRVSIKDKWAREGTGEYFKGLFIKGLPDNIRIDTIIEGNTNYLKSRWPDRSYEKSFLVCKNGERRIEQYTISEGCYDAECDSVIYTEAHPEWNGFWSGVIDSITLTEVTKPLVINANVLLHENSIILKKVWDVSR